MPPAVKLPWRRTPPVPVPVPVPGAVAVAEALPGPGVAAGPADRARYLDVFRVAEFRAIFAADVVSMLGNVVAEVALIVLVYQRTRSPALAASVMALSFLPYLIGGVLLGAAADRLPVRAVLVTCDLISAGLVAAMLIPGVPIAGLLTLLFANGLVAPVYQGARAAVLPDILPPGPRYILGRSLMRQVAQTAQIAGFGAGGLLLAITTPRGALALDAVSFAASAIVLRLGMARRPAQRSGTGSMAGDSLAGIRSVFGHRTVRRMLLFSWLVPACAVAPEALAAPYASHIGQPARVAGFLLMGIPAGTVLADLIVARLFSSRLQRRIVGLAAVVSFVPLAAFAGSPGLGLAIGLLVISGLGSAWAVGLDALLIGAAPAGLRSRALALASAGLMFTQGAGFAFWGLAGQVLPPTMVIPAAAAAGLLVVAALRPRRGDRG